MKSLERLPHSLIWNPETRGDLVDCGDWSVVEAGKGAVAGHKNASNCLVIYRYVAVPSPFIQRAHCAACNLIGSQ